MHPIMFKIGSITFYSHGLFAVAGIILGSLIIYLLSKKSFYRDKISREFYFDNIVFVVLTGIIGARIAYFLLYHDQFSNFSEIFFLWNGGLVSYGGFILGGAALYLLLKTQKQPVLIWMDLFSIGFFFALFVGRIGDLMAGEYNGRALENGEKYLNIFNAFPVSMFEAVLCFVIFLLGYFVYNNYSTRLKNGIIFIASCLVYLLGRFFLDFYRTEADIFWKISFGQLVSIVLFVIFIVFLLLNLKKTALQKNVFSE